MTASLESYPQAPFISCHGLHNGQYLYHYWLLPYGSHLDGDDNTLDGRYQVQYADECDRIRQGLERGDSHTSALYYVGLMQKTSRGVVSDKMAA